MTDHEKSHDQEILKQRLLELPEEMLVHVRHGFSSFAKSAAITRERVATTILERLSSRDSIDIEELANENGIEKSTTADIATAISVIVGATNDLKINVGDFTSYARGNLFDDEYYSQILELETSVLNSKGEIADALQTSRLANAVLPSVRGITGEIDIRLSFNEDGSIERQVPVAVFYFSTDCDQEIWFQATKNDVEKLYKLASRMKTNLEFAEKINVKNSAFRQNQGRGTMSVTLTIPPYWELYIYSSVGALLLWTKLTMQKRKLQSLSEIFQEIFPNSQRLQNLSQFAFFVLFGGFIGILAVGPYTQLQALAGGVAWSRLSARD